MSFNVLKMYYYLKGMGTHLSWCTWGGGLSLVSDIYWPV